MESGWLTRLLLACILLLILAACDYLGAMLDEEIQMRKSLSDTNLNKKNTHIHEHSLRRKKSSSGLRSIHEHEDDIHYENKYSKSSNNKFKSKMSRALDEDEDIIHIKTTDNQNKVLRFVEGQDGTSIVIDEDDVSGKNEDARKTRIRRSASSSQKRRSLPVAASFLEDGPRGLEVRVAGEEGYDYDEDEENEREENRDEEREDESYDEDTNSADRAGTSATRSTKPARSVRADCLPKLVCELAGQPAAELGYRERHLLDMIRSSGIGNTAEVASRWHFAVHMGQLLADTQGCAALWSGCPLAHDTLLDLARRLTLKR